MIRKAQDLAGQAFGHLSAVSLVEGARSKTGRDLPASWRFRCACGQEVIRRADAVKEAVRRGQQVSCGCALREQRAAHARRVGHANRRHGHSPQTGESPTYLSWLGMHRRCANPTAPRYLSYGGRGISVCPRWGNFDQFLADMGERPEGASLDRIDTDKDYSPENCRWASQKTQQNNRRNNRRLTVDGITRTVAQWAELRQICYGTLMARLRNGWSEDLAVLTPARAGNYKRKDLVS